MDDYKKDALIQTRGDTRYIATAYRLLLRLGLQPRSISEIAWTTFKLFIDLAVENSEVEMVELTSEARAILSTITGQLNPSGRGLKNLQHNLQLDGRRFERMIDTPLSDELKNERTEAIAKEIERVSREIALGQSRVVETVEEEEDE